MKVMKKIYITLVSLLPVAINLAEAQMVSDYYLNMEVGTGLDNIAVYPRQGYKTNNEFSKPKLYSLSLGHKFGQQYSNIRTEFAFSYIDHLKYNEKFPASKQANTSSVAYDLFIKADNRLIQNIKTQAFMLNVYYDFLPNRRGTPYLGLGMGVAHKNVSPMTNRRFDSAKNIIEYTYRNTTKQNQFGYNLMTGINFKLAKSFSLNFNYRYYHLGKIRAFEKYSNKFMNGKVIPSTQKQEEPTMENNKVNINLHTVSLGLRYDF